MVLLRSLGALLFVIGVAMLTLDAARSLKMGAFEVTSLERFWINLGLESLFHMRFHFSNWFGPMAEKILELPAAFVAFGLGMAMLIAFDGAQREKVRKPLLF